MENLRLLLVDDETEFRQIIGRRLNRRGINFVMAENGDKCIEILETTPIDVVILDVKMPGISGIEVLHHIKQHYPKIEVILLTAHACASDGIEGIKGGAFDYLTKPVEFEHLLSKIKQAYEKLEWENEKHKETEFRKKMEGQMIITERLAALGTLATGVAHEINNPLAIIKESAGWLKLILKKEEMATMPRKPDFEKALGKIEHSVERARRITHQLLEFVPKSDSVFSEVNMKELVGECIQLLYREATNRDVEIIQEMPPSANIWSDAYQIRQVLLNLITNAIHASKSGGKIIVSIKPLQLGIELKVSDTGEGIPKENLKKIFEPFFSTKSPGKGTGLGLFVTSGIVDKLGGKIHVESQVGVGATFTIELPKYQSVKEKIQ